MGRKEYILVEASSNGAISLGRELQFPCGLFETMGDPTGIVGALTEQLLDRVIKQATNTINCRRNCEDLRDTLQQIRPLLAEAVASLHRDSYTNTTGTAGPDATKKWLEDLESVLNDALELVSRCNSTPSWSIISLSNLSSEILKVTEKIEKRLSQAPLAVFAVSLANNRLLARALGGKTQAILQVEGIKPPQASGEIRRQYNKLVASVHRDSGQTSSSQQNEQEDYNPSNLSTFRQVPEKTFGMDVPLAKLQDLLLGEIEGMKWVGVYGKGGIGKTLLAEQAYNSEVIQNHFQKNTFWLEVGKSSSTERLLKKLCRMLNVYICDTDEKKDVKTKLFNKLRGKKVLLVLDDVWDHGVLDELDVTSNWDSGSKILVTKRDIEVLKAGYIPTVKMESLSDGDSWELFCFFAFGGVDKVPRALDELGRAVADECKGLPLALKVIGGAQAGQRLPEQWQRALKKLKEAEPLDKDHQDKVYNRLKLSYDSLELLDHRLQKCFIYFAAFPEDSDVDVDKLVNLWAGEKLLAEAGDDMDPSEVGHFLLTVLIGRSLIDLQSAQWSHVVNSRKLKCRVHDVLRDLARHLIRQTPSPMDCLFSAGERLTKFPDTWLTPIPPSILELRGPRPSRLTNDPTHVSLNANVLESLPSKLKAPRLEVLLLANNETKRQLVISPGFLESFNMLKVLDLEHSLLDSLPESVENLTNLIYLELSFTGLRKLPLGLRKLTKLENLGLQGCRNLEPWPFDISCLKSLSSLNTRGCGNVWKVNLGSQGYSHIFPDLDDLLENLCSLTPLRNLYNHIFIPKSPDSLESLCSLTALQSLSISGDRDHLPSKMASLVNLRHLSILLRHLTQLPSELHHSDGPRLSKLQYFSLDNCMALSELPSWIDSLVKLQNLNLVSCTGLISLPNLHKLQNLQKLDLSLCTRLRELPSGFTSNGAFPALMELDMMDCVGLDEFPPIEEGAFPQLTILHLTGCAFQNLPSSLSFLPELKELKLNLCRRLKTLDDCFCLPNRDHCDSGGQLHGTERYFANLQELGLKEIPLQNLPNDLGACPALNTIDLRNTHVPLPENLKILQANGKLTILT